MNQENQENQELDDLVLGNCDTGIPRYLSDNFVKPATGDPYGSSGCVETLKNFPIKLYAFDLLGEGIWNNLGKNYFSESKMIIPPNFKLVTDAFKVGTILTLGDITTMKNNSKQISPDRVFMSFIHSINNRDSIVHPCTKSTSGESTKAYVGAKVCAYPLFTVTMDPSDFTLKETHLLFYVENPKGGKVAKELQKLYFKYNATPPTATTPRPTLWYTNAISTDDWTNVFIIPLMIPNASVVFNVVADTDKGRDYLVNWLNNVKLDTWIPIDVIKDPIEEWEVDITLDARVQ